MKKELITGEGVKRRHKTAVHELNTKKKHLKLRVHCTSLMEKLEEKTQELVQKQQKLDQTKQEPLDWGYSLGRSVYEEYDLPSHFQWSSNCKPSSAHGAGQQGLPLVHWPSQPDKTLQYLYRSTD